MFVYNTTFLIKESRFDQWREFLEKEIAPIFTDELGFTEPQLMRIHCEAEKGHATIAFQVKAETVKQIEQWRSLYEANANSRLFKLFGEEVLPFSTVMEII